jgi:tRNA1(Val) A37 N6-methylase TrmN6
MTKLSFFELDALTDLRKIPDNSVDVAICSPPYYPSPRQYNPDDPCELGHEPARAKYLERLRRILRDQSSAKHI